MNKITSMFLHRNGEKGGLLSLYFCAGSTSADDTSRIILTLQRRGISMIEVGIPFSDPLADGPVIQTASTRALRNGMSLRLLFSQLKEIKSQVSIPLILMGYHSRHRERPCHCRAAQTAVPPRRGGGAHRKRKGRQGHRDVSQQRPVLTKTEKTNSLYGNNKIQI